MTTTTLAPTLTGEEIVALCRRHTIFEWSAQTRSTPSPWTGPRASTSGLPRQALPRLQLPADVHQHRPRAPEGGQGDPGAGREAGLRRPRHGHRASGAAWRELATLTPGDIDTFFFTMGGAEANENAIRIARAFTGRHKILARYRSYHGATAGAIALTGDPRRWAREPGIPGIVRIPDFHKWGKNYPEPAAASSPRSRTSSATRAAPHRGLHYRNRHRHERHPGSP